MVTDSETPSDVSGVLDMPMFRYSLDWLLDMCRRYGTPVFSLLGLRLIGLSRNPMAGPLDAAACQARISALLDELPEILREADRCTRVDPDQLWLLLPNTDGLGLDKIKKRLSHLVHAHEDDAFRIELHMAGVLAPLDTHADDDADRLMGCLASSLVTG